MGSGADGDISSEGENEDRESISDDEEMEENDGVDPSGTILPAPTGTVLPVPVPSGPVPLPSLSVPQVLTNQVFPAAAVNQELVAFQTGQPKADSSDEESDPYNRDKNAKPKPTANAKKLRRKRLTKDDDRRKRKKEEQHKKFRAKNELLKQLQIAQEGTESDDAESLAASESEDPFGDMNIPENLIDQETVDEAAAIGLTIEGGVEQID